MSVHSPNGKSFPLPMVNIPEVRRTLQVLTRPEQVTELRILSARTTVSPRFVYQASGYFNDPEALIKSLASLQSAKGVYITLHPCNPMLLARAHNRLRSADEMRKAAATSDLHIARLHWLLIDLDPERPADISSTDEEHQMALVQAQVIKKTLAELGWPDPIEADSGNGAHLLYRVDLPREEGKKETGLLHRVLKGLARRFDPPEIGAEEEPLRLLVDQTVFNPSRICKLYGTLACKGDHTAERPHRLSRLLVVPASQELVSKELLAEIAAPLPERSIHAGTPRETRGGQFRKAEGARESEGAREEKGSGADSFDLEAWIAEHQLDVSDPTPWQDGRKWVFHVCPWNEDHTDNSAFIVQHADGSIGAGCHHNSCQDQNWRTLRAVYEPEWLTRTVGISDECVTDLPAFISVPDDQQELAAVTPAFVLQCLQRAEEGDARLFAHLFRGRCVYDHTEGQWYLWQGHSWKRDEYQKITVLVSNHLAVTYLEVSAQLSGQGTEQVDSLAEGSFDKPKEAQFKERYEWLKRTTNELIERARKLRTWHRIRNVLMLARTFLPILSGSWDVDPWLLGTPDGVLDLRSGMLQPGRPEDYIRKIIPTRFLDLSTPAPRFEQFLREIFADRAEDEREALLTFLQRVLGYGITGKVTEHVFLMLYGEEGRNGKDTLMTILLHVLGEAVGPVSNDVILANRLTSPGSAKPHLCSLQGKRMAWASEADRGARFDIGQVKFLTGGGAIAARQLYGREYAFDPSHLLILLTNHKPHADASDAAFWERLCLVLFNMRFVEQPAQPNERQRDTTLGMTLEGEASGILAWLVRGCLDWQQNGLTIPTSLLISRQSYRDEEDTLGDFFKTCCEVNPATFVSARELYVYYRQWCEDNSLKILNGLAFGQEMKKRFAWQHRREGNIYYGLKLKENVPNDDLEDVKDFFRGKIRYEASPQAGSAHIYSETCEGLKALSQNFPKYESTDHKIEKLFDSYATPSQRGEYDSTINQLEPPVELFDVISRSEKRSFTSFTGSFTPVTPPAAEPVAYDSEVPLLDDNYGDNDEDEQVVYDGDDGDFIMYDYIDENGVGHSAPGS